MTGARLAIGVDIGGTKVAAALVDSAGRTHHWRARPTPTEGAREVEDALVDLVAPLLARVRAQLPPGGVVPVGVGAAGFVDVRAGEVCFSAHLPWRHEPLAARLSERLATVVTLDNDANAALWAEHRFGAVRGCPDVLGVNVGTGIGGAVLAGGALYRGAAGMAGELGHVRVVPNGRRCRCGARGCLETYASGRALVLEARSLIRRARRDADAAGTARLLALADGRPERLTGRAVARAARTGDPLAQAALERVGGWLGQGLADAVANFDPALIVIGGGVAQAGELLLEPARNALAARIIGRGFRRVPEVLPGAFGERAGVIGAATLAAALAPVPATPGGEPAANRG